VEGKENIALYTSQAYVKLWEPRLQLSTRVAIRMIVALFDSVLCFACSGYFEGRIASIFRVTSYTTHTLSSSPQFNSTSPNSITMNTEAVSLSETSE
jgi:hypothetical protein